MSATISLNVASSPDLPTAAWRQAHERALQRRHAWVRECRLIALSYVINGAFIGLFALTGTVSWVAGLLYAGPGLAVTAAFAYLISRERSIGLNDPSLSNAHAATSATLCVLGVALFPQIVFAYALILFVTFITATFRTPKRQVHAGLVVVSLLVGLLTLGLGRELQIPHATRGEQFIAWLFFLVTLGRCVMLSVINADTDRLMRQRSLQLANTVAQIERMANHDELTGVLNRGRLMQILADEMARVERSPTPLSVALLDLDHFKTVNDTLGHLAGDHVLRLFASAVQTHMRTTDRFGRYGGEEFLIILTDADGPQAERAVERIREAMLPTDWSAIEPTLRVSFSAGIASLCPGDSAEVWLNRADLGLYAAKRDGRNCTRVV